MVQYMVNVLMLLSPDYPSDLDLLDPTVAAWFEEGAFSAPVTLQQMQKEAFSLSEKVNSFSFYIIKCCQELVEHNPIVDEDGYELRQLQSIKSSCSEWIETCQMLLSNITDYAAPTEMAEESQNTENKEFSARRSHTTDTSAQDVVRIIGYDGNICKKALKEEEIPVFAQGVLTASRPSTPRSIQAFESLTSLEQLEKRLLEAELRAQTSEERSESLEEELKAALQKIQELEVKSSVEKENKKEFDETPAHSEVKSEQLSLPVPTKKRPKSSKAKHHM